MARAQLETGKGITREQFKDLANCSRDPFYFATFVYVIHPVQGKIKFDLYKYQKSVLYHFLKNRFNIVLKFRQAGLTELISMYCLWLAMFHPNKNIQIISIKDRVAKKVLRRIKYMYRNLPYYLRISVVNGRPGEIGCVTRDTVLVGDHGDFKIGTITPPNIGWVDISHLGLKVLTHDGTFERVLKSVNKGELETWEIENNKGNKLRCTWNHQLLTTYGWKTVKEVLEKDLTCIFWDTNYLDNIKAPNTNPPPVEEIGNSYGTGSKIASELGLTTKEVSGYRRGLRGSHIYISKIKRTGITKEEIVDLEIENSHSYVTKSEYVNHNTGTEIEFSNGSTITSIPTTEDAGRSEAVSLLVIDEAAIVRWATQIWAAAFPTLSTGGSSIINSTPYGVGNFYHKQWVDAVAGGNEFFPIRLHWRMHPERDNEWYRVMSSALGPRRTAQEIDGDFLTSGNSVFDLTDIKAIEDGLSELDIHETRLNGNLVIVRLPVKGEKYFIGADIATGRSRDYSAFSVMDRSGYEVAYYKGKISVSQFADLLMEIGTMYNQAVLAPESNDIGLSVTTKIQESGYPNLFYTTKFLKEKGEPRPKKSKLPGWYTDRKTRPIIIDELEEDIRNDSVEITNKFFIQEAYTFIYDERNRPVAMGKHNRGSEEDDILDDENTYTDDSILAESITNFIRKGKVTTTVVAPI